ncbi:Pericentrin [Hexamita inflata]|uniref:Pericentrin n=1 Tax=Hexamita inflata TaxID=28002 RepID=A0AA86ND99_9EUKA|nr:Pericentrin [Hexamita inflata]
MIDFNYVTQLHKQAQKGALTKHEELNTAGTNQRRPSEVFKLKINQAGLFDKNGNQINQAGLFDKNGNQINQAGLFDKNGNAINQAGLFDKNGNAINQAGLFDKNGNQINQAGLFHKNGNAINQAGLFDKNGNAINQAGLFDKNGNAINQAGLFDKNGNAINQAGLFNKNGNQINQAGLFDKNGNAINQAGLFDKNGNQINQAGLSDKNGNAINQAGLFDKNGNAINQAGLFDKNGNAINQAGLFDKNGNAINQAGLFDKNGNAINQADLFDKNGNQINQAVSSRTKQFQEKTVYDRQGNIIGVKKVAYAKIKKTQFNTENEMNNIQTQQLTNSDAKNQIIDDNTYTEFLIIENIQESYQKIPNMQIIYKQSQLSNRVEPLLQIPALFTQKFTKQLVQKPIPNTVYRPEELRNCNENTNMQRGRNYVKNKFIFMKEYSIETVMSKLSRLNATKSNNQNSKLNYSTIKKYKQCRRVQVVFQITIQCSTKNKMLKELMHLIYQYKNKLYNIQYQGKYLDSYISRILIGYIKIFQILRQIFQQAVQQSTSAIVIVILQIIVYVLQKPRKWYHKCKKYNLHQLSNLVNKKLNQSASYKTRQTYVKIQHLSYWLKIYKVTLQKIQIHNQQAKTNI